MIYVVEVELDWKVGAGLGDPDQRHSQRDSINQLFVAVRGSHVGVDDEFLEGRKRTSEARQTSIPQGTVFVGNVDPNLNAADRVFGRPDCRGGHHVTRNQFQMQCKCGVEDVTRFGVDLPACHERAKGFGPGREGFLSAFNTSLALVLAELRRSFRRYYMLISEGEFPDLIADLAGKMQEA